MVPEQSFVTIKDASKTYSKRRMEIPGFEGLDLEIAEGVFIALMAPSGSVKCTLSHAFAGLERLDSGTFNIGCQQIEALGQSKLSKWRAATFGLVFQLFNLMRSLIAYPRGYTLQTSLSGLVQRFTLPGAIGLFGSLVPAISTNMQPVTSDLTR